MPRRIELHPMESHQISIPRSTTGRLRLTNGPWKMPVAEPSSRSNARPSERPRWGRWPVSRITC